MYFPRIECLGEFFFESTQLLSPLAILNALHKVDSYATYYLQGGATCEVLNKGVITQPGNERHYLLPVKQVHLIYKHKVTLNSKRSKMLLPQMIKKKRQPSMARVQPSDRLTNLAHSSVPIFITVPGKNYSWSKISFA